MSKGKGRGAMALRGGIPELMKQAHRMQTRLEKAKEEIKAESWVAEAAGGKIRITINGAMEITAVAIDKELVNPEDLQTLQDVVLAAGNAAIKLAEEKIGAATDAITGGMKIPGLL